MKFIKFSACLITVLCFAGLAKAEGPYVSFMGGAAILSDADNTQAGITLTSTFDTGLLISGAGGYGWSNGLRVEGEIGYRANDVDSLEVLSVSVPAGGDVTALSVMVNVAYDFKAAPQLKPYVLAGLGFAAVSADVSLPGLDIVDDDDQVFAWQVGGGVAFEVAPKVDIFADYRYFATSDPTFMDVTGSDFDSEYSSHNVSAGVRVSF